MYKIDFSKKGEDVAYAKAYAAKLLPLIDDYLNKGKVLDVAVKNRETVHVAVGKNTLTRKILNQLSDVAFLEKYLLMKPTAQVRLINKLAAIKKYPEELIFKKITVGLCGKYQMLAHATFDHFNEIMYDIFVNGVYDGKGAFDKRAFIRDSGLRVCPYCGMEFIKPTNRTKPTLSPDDLKGNKLLVKLVATKEQSWSYEEETRIVTDKSGHHDIPASALYGIIFGSQMSEKDKQKIKDVLVGRNVKFYQLSRKVDAYGYEHKLVDENKVSSFLDDNLYDYKCKSMPVVDNFFVKLKFMPSSEEEVKDFIFEFKKKHADRQCNIYVHDMDVDMEKLNDADKNYEYLHKHLIAEGYFDTAEVLFNSEYEK